MKSHRNYRQPPNFHTAIEWLEQEQATGEVLQRARTILKLQPLLVSVLGTCLLYTSDAADDIALV